MAPSISLVLMLVALFCFIFAAMGTSSRIELKSAGLACLTGAFIAARWIV